MHDLEPATRQLAVLIGGVTDDQLGAPTPCEMYRLGDLIEHIDGLSLAFAAAARKDLGPLTSQAQPGDAARLAADWRTRIPEQLAALADAWRRPDAADGMTQVGGIDLPGAFAGSVALGEVVLHGWDVARASEQPFGCDEQTLQACLEYVSTIRSMDLGPGSPFGPPVDVPADASLLDRLLGLSGRDPDWKPA